MDPILVVIGNATAAAVPYDVVSLVSSTARPNTSANHTDEMRELFDEPLWIEVIFGFLFAIVTVLGVGGNAVVCYIVLGHARMRTVTNYSIVNLAVSDILMAVMCVNFSFYAAMYLSWPFGEFMCKAVSFIQSVSVSVSIFTLVSISVDRYIAICHPLALRMGSSQALTVIAAIWLVSCVVALPSLIYSKVGDEGDSSFCSETHWEHTRIYTYVLMGIQYFVPLCVLAIAYGRIGYVIWSRRTPGETQACRDRRINESKTKLVKVFVMVLFVLLFAVCHFTYYVTFCLVKMFAMVVLLFALCYLPIHTFNIVQELDENVLYFRYIKLVYLAVLLAAMSNCVYNPFIYCWMNAKFRNGFKSVFRFLPGVNYDPEWKIMTHLERRNTAMTQMTSMSERRGFPRGASTEVRQCWPEHCYEAINSDDNGSPARHKIAAV